jgi:hypothetical protein
VANLVDILLVRNFIRNQQHSDWGKNFETSVLVNNETAANTMVFFQKKYSTILLTYKHAHENLRMVVIASRCIRENCTRKCKITSFVSIHIYSCSRILIFVQTEGFLTDSSKQWVVVQ